MLKKEEEIRKDDISKKYYIEKGEMKDGNKDSEDERIKEFMEKDKEDENWRGKIEKKIEIISDKEREKKEEEKGKREEDVEED